MRAKKAFQHQKVGVNVGIFRFDVAVLHDIIIPVVLWFGLHLSRLIFPLEASVAEQKRLHLGEITGGKLFGIFLGFGKGEVGLFCPLFLFAGH